MQNDNSKLKIYKIIICIMVVAVVLLPGLFLAKYQNFKQIEADNLRFDDQEATILAVKKVIPAVVSIIIYDQEENIIIDLEKGAQQRKTERVQKGSGTGFLISADGLIITNKHVVNAGQEKTAEYKIILNSGKKYYAQLIGKDPINDLAVLKIFDKNLPYVELGDSDQLQLGSTVMAIGNTLGRYQNSTTKGIVSGLGRSIAAGDQEGGMENLDNVIQTDAEINFGNSGGPLVDLNGKVVGVNVAIDKSGASIGFAIPINDAKLVVRTVKQIGRIVRPRLGIRYIMLTPEIAEEKKLKISNGALVIKDEETGGPAVLPNSPAAQAGIKEGDIIIEINKIKLKERPLYCQWCRNISQAIKLGLE